MAWILSSAGVRGEDLPDNQLLIVACVTPRVLAIATCVSFIS